VVVAEKAAEELPETKLLVELGVVCELFGDECGCFLLNAFFLEHFVDLDVVEETVETSSDEVVEFKENEKTGEVLHQFE